MAMKIKFDVAHNPEEPTFVLAKKNGDKIGKINAFDIEVVGSLNDANEISFTVYKELNGEKDYLWDEITNFRLVYCLEWNKWFEITTELDESAETKKTVSGKSLGQAELSQINLYNIQINTEDDIARDDYVVPTVLYRKNGNLTKEEQDMAESVLGHKIFYLDNYKSASLLDRIMEKAPHYKIAHVDDTIAHIQREFEFDDTSLYDAFQDIAEEINCLFVFNSDSDKDGNMQRSISVYDLESNCLDCGNRDEFTMVCPKCGSKNINEGYGEDTGIFISSDEIAESIQLSIETDKVKNCFKLEAGDDDVTAAVRLCNPNGTDYIWHITDATKKDMSNNLVEKIAEYDKKYAQYNNEKDYYSLFDSSTVNSYNELIDKYNEFDEEFKDDEALTKIPSSIIGYKSLANIYYDAEDFGLYLESSLMPNAKLEETNSAAEAAKLTSGNFGEIGTSGSLKNISKYTADNLVLSMAKVLVDYRYAVEVNDSSLSGTVWTGSFIVKNMSDEDEKTTSKTISLTITDDQKTFVRQKVEKSLAKGDNEDVSISGLFKKDLISFKSVLKKYSLSRLKSFSNACQSCLEVMTEQGIAQKDSWDGENLYNELYDPYYKKNGAIEDEMNLRQDEIDIIDSLKECVNKIMLDTQNELNFEIYLGENLWHEMCSFRREDKFSNDNYTSDGLNNAQIIKRANDFIEEANKEIYKSAEQQISISADLHNLLVIEKFKPIVNSFELGNFIRVTVDDELYKLRLIEYTIDYSSLDKISVEFSDAVNVASTIRSIQGVLDQASSMATSYDSIKRQAEQATSSSNKINNWVNKGLDLTNMKIISSADNQNITWDSHGILCREYDPISEQYDNRQLKIINRGLYVTSDNWETARAGIGNFIYYDPSDRETKEGYGVIADTLVGNLILSKKVGIYNEENSITLDDNGIVITVEDDTAKTKTAFTIQKELSDNTIKKLMYVDSNGNLVLNGSLKVESSDGDDEDTLGGMKTSIDQNTESIILNASDAKNYTDSQIKIVSDEITLGVSDAKNYTDSQIKIVSDEITLGVSDAKNYTDSQIKISTDSIESTVSSIDGRVTKIRQDLDNISSEVDSKASKSYVDQKADSVTTTIEAKGYQTASQVSQTLSSWKVSMTDIDGLSSYMSFTNDSGTGTLTLGGSASSVSLGGSASTINLGGSVSTINLCGGKAQILSVSSSSGTTTLFRSGNGGIGVVSNTTCIYGTDGDIVFFTGSGGNGYVGNDLEVTHDISAARQVNSKGAYMNVNIGPKSSGGASCGSSTYKWSAVYAEKGTIQTSSRKVKENIEPESEGKAKRLLDVDVVKFDYKEGFLKSVGRKGWYGVIAEDVHEDFPDVVLDWDVTGEVDELTGEPVEVYPGVNYEAFVPHLIKLCQMQQKQIDELIDKVNALTTV